MTIRGNRDGWSETGDGGDRQRERELRQPDEGDDGRVEQRSREGRRRERGHVNVQVPGSGSRRVSSLQQRLRYLPTTTSC